MANSAASLRLQNHFEILRIPFKACKAPALTYLSELLTPQEPSCSVTCTDVPPPLRRLQGQALNLKETVCSWRKRCFLKSTFKTCSYGILLLCYALYYYFSLEPLFTQLWFHEFFFYLIFVLLLLAMQTLFLSVFRAWYLTMPISTGLCISSFTASPFVWFSLCWSQSVVLSGHAKAC